MARRAAPRRHHVLVLDYRGAEHVHTWWPSCTCGWSGVPARRKWSEAQYAEHVSTTDARERALATGSSLQPRPTTELTPKLADAFEALLAAG